MNIHTHASKSEPHSRLALGVALLDHVAGELVELAHRLLLSGQRVSEVFVSLQQCVHRLDRVLQEDT